MKSKRKVLKPKSSLLKEKTFYPALHAENVLKRATVFFRTVWIKKKKKSGMPNWMVGGPIAVARRGGVTLTLQEMSMFFTINNMILAGSTYWNMVIAGPEGTALADTEGIETIRLFGANVAKIIKKVRD